MRQLLIEVQRGEGNTVIHLGEKYEGANLSQLDANTSRGKIDLAFASGKPSTLLPQPR